MTNQDNIIDYNADIEKENNSFVFYHMNRLLIVALSTIALAFDGYQVPDIFYGVSIVIWLWLPEIELIERKITRKIIKQFSIMLLSASIVIAIYMILFTFVQISQLLPYYKPWLMLVIVVTGSIPLFLKMIIWLATNNPVDNIGNEFKNEGA